MAEKTFGRTPKREYYLGGVAGARENKRYKSQRKKTDRDEVRPGEYYKAPHDEPDRLVEAIEEPGVLAGTSAIHNLPNIHGEWEDIVGGCVYCPN